MQKLYDKKKRWCHPEPIVWWHMQIFVKMGMTVPTSHHYFGHSHLLFWANWSLRANFLLELTFPHPLIVNYLWFHDSSISPKLFGKHTGFTNLGLRLNFSGSSIKAASKMKFKSSIPLSENNFTTTVSLWLVL